VDTRPKIGDVVWSKIRHQGGEQWIRVVVEYLYTADPVVVVHALFPGDSHLQVWTVRIEDLREEEPTFDEVDATYEGGDFEFA